MVVLGRVVGAGDDRSLGIGSGAGICARLDAPGEPASGEHLQIGEGQPFSQGDSMVCWQGRMDRAWLVLFSSGDGCFAPSFRPCFCVRRTWGNSVQHRDSAHRERNRDKDRGQQPAQRHQAAPLLLLLPLPLKTHFFYAPTRVATVATTTQRRLIPATKPRARFPCSKTVVVRPVPSPRVREMLLVARGGCCGEPVAGAKSRQGFLSMVRGIGTNLEGLVLGEGSGLGLGSGGEPVERRGSEKTRTNNNQEPRGQVLSSGANSTLRAQSVQAIGRVFCRHSMLQHAIYGA
jgi:hypothetical protein